MSLTLDFSTDYLVWDNPEAVTLVGASSTSTPFTDTVTATGTWTAPAGLDGTTVAIVAIGNGADGVIGVGGGGGAYAAGDVGVTASTAYAVTINGTSAKFVGNSSAKVEARSGSGATAGSASLSTGITKYAGGAGATGTASAAGGGGGAAGPTAAGSPGTVSAGGATGGSPGGAGGTGGDIFGAGVNGTDGATYGGGGGGFATSGTAGNGGGGVVKITGATLSTVSVSTALRLPVSNRERLASQGVYTSLDRMWCLPGPLLSGHTPIPGDQILDADEVSWTILEISGYSELTDTHNCLTRNLVLANGLTDSIDIETATVTQTATGAKINTWATKYSGIRCRMQPEQTEDMDGRGKKATQIRYLIPVERQIDPRNSAGDWGRVKFGSQYLEITGYKQSERIDELPIIEATLDSG